MFIGSEILAPDLVWQDLGDLLDPNYFQTMKVGERERERERERVGENLLVGTFVGLTPE